MRQELCYLATSAAAELRTKEQAETVFDYPNKRYKTHALKLLSFSHRKALQPSF